MTCIVALRHEQSVLLGGDSAGCMPTEINIMVEPKVFKNGRFVIGYTGSFRVGQLLQYSFKPPRLMKQDNIREYMVNKFVKALQKCLKGHAAIKQTSTQMADSAFIVAIDTHIYVVEGDYAVSECATDFIAAGIGSPYALGSLYTSEGSPEDRVIKSLKVAAHFSPWVREPFTLVWT